MEFSICFKKWGMNKLSLKDRLNKQQQQTPAQRFIQEQVQQPKYYNNEKEAQLDSLGILDTLFIDEDLNSVFVSGAKNIYLEKKGKIHKSTTTYRDNVQVENMIKKIANNAGVKLDEINPYFEFNQETGINVKATLPPLSNVPSLFVKCYKDKHANLETLQEELSISKEIALILNALCSIKKNILIVGESSTLKTTLLSALAKKTPANDRGVVIDCENEIKIENQNTTNYNFSTIKEDDIKNSIIDSIIATSIEKLFINSKDEKLLVETILKIENSFKGAVMTLNVSSTVQAIEKLAQIIQKHISYLTLEKARTIVLNTFDIIITVKKDEIGRRKISSISEINLLSSNDIIQEIITLDYQNQHNSTGIIPAFYEDIKNNSLPISDNIFSENYKHTYHKAINMDSMSQFGKKGPNVDILKKFKKELPTQEEQVSQNTETPENETQEQVQENQQNIEANQNELLMQRAQEKFNELKKTAQKQGDFELKVEDFEQNQNEQNESI